MIAIRRMAQKQERVGGSQRFDSGDAGTLFLDKEGRWFHEGIEITHRKTIELFSSSVVKDPAGGYRLQVGRECARIEVEDTPYMVRLVEVGADDIMLELNDFSRERLKPHTLRMGSENVLYCRVKDADYPARFLRPAYYQIMELLEQDREDFYLKICGTRWPLNSKTA